MADFKSWGTTQPQRIGRIFGGGLSLTNTSMQKCTVFRKQLNLFSCHCTFGVKVSLHVDHCLLGTVLEEVYFCRDIKASVCVGCPTDHMFGSKHSCIKAIMRPISCKCSLTNNWKKYCPSLRCKCGTALRLMLHTAWSKYNRNRVSSERDIWND